MTVQHSPSSPAGRLLHSGGDWPLTANKVVYVHPYIARRRNRCRSALCLIILPNGGEDESAFAVVAPSAAAAGAGAGLGWQKTNAPVSQSVNTNVSPSLASSTSTRVSGPLSAQ